MFFRNVNVRMITLALLLMASLPSSADVESSLNQFFDSMGYGANVTPPGAYQGQMGGYYSGGSVYARSPVRNYNLATVQMPRLRAGCGGIDLFTGSYSFIDSAQLEATMRNIGNNARGLMWSMAISVLSPKLEGLIAKFTNMANVINNASINSCEAAASLLGSALPKSEASQKALCQNIGASNGFSDYAAARQGCGAGGERANTLTAAQTNPQYKDQLGHGNFVWRVLKKLSVTAGDPALAEAVMSLTGTLVFPLPANDDTPVSPRYFPSAINLEEGLRHFLRGGQIEILRCADGTDEFECLDVQNDVTTIAVTTGFATKVEAMLSGMVDAAANDRRLTDAQLDLLNETSLPVYKMLNVATAYSSAYANTWKSTYAEAIAVDLLFTYFRQLVNLLQHGVSTMPVPEDTAEKFKRDIAATQRQLEKVREISIARVDRTIQMMRETQTIERMLISSLSPGLAGSFAWARSQ